MPGHSLVNYSQIRIQFMVEHQYNSILTSLSISILSQSFPYLTRISRIHPSPLHPRDQRMWEPRGGERTYPRTETGIRFYPSDQPQLRVGLGHGPGPPPGTSPTINTPIPIPLPNDCSLTGIAGSVCRPRTRWVICGRIRGTVYPRR